MIKKVSLAVHHRESVGNYIRSQDQKQKSYRYQNNLVTGLAKQKGLHSENRQRRNISIAMVRLFSLFSSIQSNSTYPLIKQRYSSESYVIHHNLQEISHQHTDIHFRNACSKISNEADQTEMLSQVNDLDMDKQRVLISSMNRKMGNVIEQVIDGLHKVSDFILRHDPLSFPSVGASQISEENNVTYKDDIVFSNNIEESDQGWFSKRNNLIDVFNNGSIKSEWSKINEYYNKYQSKYPTLLQLASGKLKNEIYYKYKLDIDPDRVFFIKFSNTMYYGREKIHFSPTYINKTLTECLFTNFGGSIQDNMQDMDAMCGIYMYSSPEKKEYHASEEVKIKPTAFINLVWNIDFYTYAKNKINEKYENSEDQSNKLIVDFFLHISICDLLDGEQKRDILKCVLGLKCGNFFIFNLYIGDYQSSNAFLFRDNLSKNFIVYFPNSDFKFKWFSNDKEMNLWIINSSKDKSNREMIASHFSLENQQDGLIKDGVKSILVSLSQGSSKYRIIAENKESISPWDFFNLFAVNMKDKELSDLDYFVKSDAEVKRDMWEDMIDASAIIPNPVSPFLSLGMHIEHIMDSDTLEEKRMEWDKIRDDIINIISFIIIDKVSGKINMEEHFSVNTEEKNINTKYQSVESRYYIDEENNHCHRVARGIAATKLCMTINNIDKTDDFSLSKTSANRNYFTNYKLPKLNNPPVWYQKENILSKAISAEGVIFYDPSEPNRIIKFYRKEHSEIKANNNAKIFRKLYEGEFVYVISLQDESGRTFMAVDMPKLSGTTLADIRDEKDITKAVMVAKEFIKKDPVEGLITTLQSLNVNIKDFNVGNIIFDSTKKKFILIDFDYADMSSVVTDSLYKTMYKSLYTKIKQDFLAIEWKVDSDKKSFFIKKAINRMDKRFTALIMDGKKARLSHFKEAIERYNRETKIPVSWALKRWIDYNMPTSYVSISKLSFPDQVGLRMDQLNQRYIKISNRFFKVEEHNGRFFLKGRKEDKLYLIFKNEKFYPDNIITHGGMLSSTLEEDRLTRAINSNTGLKLNKNIVLNKSWTLSTVKIKSSNVVNNVSIGSRVDVTLTLMYKAMSKSFIDMPNLQWNESIKFKKNNNKWIYEANMFDHNPHSRFFFPWINRYIEAYHYIKSSDKKNFNGNVKVYKNDLGMISPNEIKHASSVKDMIRSVQDYLSKKGGVIEITLTDLPRLIRTYHTKNAERVLGFNVAFDDRSVLKFYQGISLPTDSEGTAFISMSDDIKLALGTANVTPPRRVTEPRVKRAL